MVWKRKIGYINLSTKKITTRIVPKKLRSLYLGGRGIAMYLLFNHLRPRIDPLGSENVFLVGGGLLNGIPCLGSGRCDIAAKSPLTGAIGDSNMGGFFAPELRFAGFDHLVIKGKSDKPVYLLIRNDEIEIKEASHLWGKDAFETQTIIIATGAIARRMRVPNEDRLWQRGISACAVCDGALPMFRNQSWPARRLALM